MKVSVRISQIKKGDRFYNEYWGREVIATTDAYRLDGTIDPENYHPTKPKPKRAQCTHNGTEYVHDWWMIEVGVRDPERLSSGIWSEVEHRSIEVEREQ